MGQADGRVGFIDVLAARSAGPIGIDAKILGTNIDLNAVVDLRIHKQRGEGGMAPGVAVKRRDADEPMNPRFGAKIAVGIGAFNGEGGVFQAAAFCRQILGNLGAKAAPLRPAQVQAQQHIGPVLGFESTGAGAQADDRVVAVVLTAEQLVHLGRADGLTNLDQCGFDLVGRLGIAGLGHFKENQGVGQRLLLRFPVADRIAQRGALFEDSLGCVLVVPEFVRADQFFERGDAGLFGGDVKDASRDCLPGSGGQSVFPSSRPAWRPPLETMIRV